MQNCAAKLIVSEKGYEIISSKVFLARTFNNKMAFKVDKKFVSLLCPFKLGLPQTVGNKES
jgi:hypothetical protein